MHYPSEVSSCPQPLFSTALKLLMAQFIYISLKLLSHQWSFRSIHLFLLLFWILIGFNLFPLFLWSYCKPFLSFPQQSSKCQASPTLRCPSASLPPPPPHPVLHPLCMPWPLWKALLHVKLYPSCWATKSRKSSITPSRASPVELCSRAPPAPSSLHWAGEEPPPCCDIPQAAKASISISLPRHQLHGRVLPALVHVPAARMQGTDNPYRETSTG